MIQFKAIFERMARDKENEVKLTFLVSAQELGKVIMIPAEVMLDVKLEPSVESQETNQEESLDDIQ